MIEIVKEALKDIRHPVPAWAHIKHITICGSQLSYPAADK